MMLYQTTSTPPPVLEIAGKLTFVGIYERYKAECETMYREKGWAESTREQYDSIIHNTIYPHILNHNYKQIGDYTRDDFEKTLNCIIESGKKRGKTKSDQYSEDTIRTFKRLIRTVVTVAYENGHTLYSIYDDDFDDAKKKKLLEYYRLHNIQPKSFSVDEEHAIAQYLSKTCLECGESVGLLLMFALGVRCAEAAGASFDDIVSVEGYDDFYCLRILHTTGINSNTLSIKGKTVNANRLIPLPKSIYKMLMQIMKVRAEELHISTAEMVAGKIPIACRGKNYMKRCDTPALSRAGRKMFTDIGMRKEYFNSLALILEEDYRAAKEMSVEEEFVLVEREVTAYALRRNAATHYYHVGMDENETSYIMGHQIYDPQIRRKDYSDPELLYRIKKKMDMRPILNDISKNKEIVHIQKNRAAEISGVSDQIVRIPPHSRTQIIATPFVAEDDIKISVISGNKNATVRIRHHDYVPETSSRSRRASMLSIYHKMYIDKFRDYVIGL